MSEQDDKDSKLPIIHRVIDDLYQGKSLKQSLCDNSIKSREFFEIVLTDPKLSSLYTHAQESRSEIFADEIIDIADNEDDQLRARNRIDARKWYASKVKPSKFGDRLDVNVLHVDINAALNEAKRRTLPVSDQQNVEDAQLIEKKLIPSLNHTDSESVGRDAKPDRSDNPFD